MVSAMTNRGFRTWSRTLSWVSGEALARNTKSLSAKLAGILGWNSPNTFSSTERVSRRFMPPKYSPDQRKVLPAANSTPAVSTPWRASISPDAHGGKSLPTTPTSRTGARNRAAREK
jgi:hypothetical protein